MATLTDNTWVVEPITGSPRFLEAGDLIPSWAADQVGRHLLDDDDTETTPYRDQKMADLRLEIDRRNVGRKSADKIDPEGHASIESYAAALEADDAEPSPGDDSGGGDGSGSGDSSGDSGSAGDAGSAAGAPAAAAPAPAPAAEAPAAAPRARRSR